MTDKAKYKGNFLDLLRSRKGASAIAGIIVLILTLTFPEQTAAIESIRNLIGVLILALIGGYTAEDVVKAFFTPANLEALQSVLDKFTEQLNGEGDE